MCLLNIYKIVFTAFYHYLEASFVSKKYYLFIWLYQVSRPPDLSLEKSVCRSRSNIQKWTWNNRLVPTWEGSMSSCILSTLLIYLICRVQFSSVSQLCPTLCDPIDCRMPGFPFHHRLPELTQTHVYRVSDAIQPSHYLQSSFPPTFNLSQHQGLFK